LEDLSEIICVIPRVIGAPNNVKMVSQLLIRIHIAAASAAIGLAV
jgi:hypothetical protein